jgi:hypothetical protein
MFKGALLIFSITSVLFRRLLNGLDDLIWVHRDKGTWLDEHGDVGGLNIGIEFGLFVDHLEEIIGLLEGPFEVGQIREDLLFNPLVIDLRAENQ